LRRRLRIAQSANHRHTVIVLKYTGYPIRRTLPSRGRERIHDLPRTVVLEESE
jgi:hypothetical protein